MGITGVCSEGADAVNINFQIQIMTKGYGRFDLKITQW